MLLKMSGDRHHYLNDREKLPNEKDLRIFVAITEDFTFLKFCALLSPDVPFNVMIIKMLLYSKHEYRNILF